MLVNVSDSLHILSVGRLRSGLYHVIPHKDVIRSENSSTSVWYGRHLVLTFLRVVYIFKVSSLLVAVHAARGNSAYKADTQAFLSPNR